MRQLEKEEAYKIIETVNNELRKYNLYGEMYNDYCGLCVDITWGDWKHEHWAVDSVIIETLDRMGYRGKYTITKQITEEDGSDCYSALHVVRFD